MFIKIGASSLLRGVHKVGACVRFGASCGGAARSADARRRRCGAAACPRRSGRLFAECPFAKSVVSPATSSFIRRSRLGF